MCPQAMRQLSAFLDHFSYYHYHRFWTNTFCTVYGLTALHTRQYFYSSTFADCERVENKKGAEWNTQTGNYMESCLCWWENEELCNFSFECKQSCTIHSSVEFFQVCTLKQIDCFLQEELVLKDQTALPLKETGAIQSAQTQLNKIDGIKKKRKMTWKLLPWHLWLFSPLNPLAYFCLCNFPTSTQKFIFAA